MVQPDRDLVFAGIFDWAFQNNFMPIDFCPKLVFESINNVLRGDRPERLPRFTGFQREDQSRLADSTRQFFRFVQLAHFALGALLLESIEFSQSAWRNLVCLSSVKMSSVKGILISVKFAQNFSSLRGFAGVEYRIQ